eukprot:1376269-Amorphochlora_amoeboformis.AAC.2
MTIESDIEPWRFPAFEGTPDGLKVETQRLQAVMSTGSEIAAYRSSRTAVGARLRRRANILGISLIVSMYLTPSALVRGESKLELSARRRGICAATCRGYDYEH